MKTKTVAETTTALTAPAEKLKYIHHYKNRHGKPVTRFRFGDFPEQTLRGEAILIDGVVTGGTPEFMAHYWQLRSSAESGQFGQAVPTFLPGSVGDVIIQYKKCEIDTKQFKGFVALASSSRSNYRRALDIIMERAGRHWMKDVTLDGLRSFRNKLTKEGFATSQIDSCLMLWSVLWTFATEFYDPEPLPLGKNPLGDILRVHGEHTPHKRWPLQVIEGVWSAGNRVMKLAIYLLLYTGQREIDVIKMKWTDYQERAQGNGRKVWMIQVVQQKTGAKVWIPCHPKLKALLDQTPRGDADNPEILLTNRGTRFASTASISGTIRSTLKKAGLAAEGYSGHGLRATAACLLLEAGNHIRVVASITGHKDLRVLEGYLTEINQEKLAVQGIDQWVMGG